MLTIPKGQKNHFPALPYVTKKELLDKCKVKNYVTLNRLIKCHHLLPSETLMITSGSSRPKYHPLAASAFVDSINEHKDDALAKMASTQKVQEDVNSLREHVSKKLRILGRALGDLKEFEAHTTQVVLALEGVESRQEAQSRRIDDLRDTCREQLDQMAVCVSRQQEIIEDLRGTVQKQEWMIQNLKKFVPGEVLTISGKVSKGGSGT